ncbi:MAG: hypothetical protein IKQ71_05245 [Lachnospiraceae bacterium]|nr:hypothetical protein [Lachnospiraceae bacterium]
MRSFINTMKYGDGKTKALMLSIAGLIVGALVLVVLAILLPMMNLFAVALVMIVIAIVLSQQYTFSDIRPYEELDEVTLANMLPEDVLTHYDEERLKMVFIRFRVRADHKPILIDRSEKHRINQVPAYIWVLKGQVHILLFEKTPREIVLPEMGFRVVRYRRNAPVNIKGEYVQMKKPSLLKKVFEDYLPQVHERGSGSVKRGFKNLYIIGDDIEITAKSAKNVFDMIDSNFEIDDKFTRSGEYGEEFIEMYKAYTLFRDQITDAVVYKNTVTRILDEMALSNMLDSALKHNLDQMMEVHFISEDYYKYCLEKRIALKKEQMKQMKKG